jgi:hypothetical protein
MYELGKYQMIQLFSRFMLAQPRTLHLARICFAASIDKVSGE